MCVSGYAIFCLGIAFACCAPVTKAVAQDATSKPPSGSIPVKEDFSAEFEKVWQTVRDRFWDSNLSGVDWTAIGSRYRVQIASVTSKTSFTALVNRMLGELHASHTEYVNDDDVGFYMLPAVMNRDMEGHQVAHIGVMGRENAVGFQVSAVLDGGPAQKAGVHAGDTILTVDGAPFTTAAAFRGKEGTTVALSLIRDGGVQPISLNVSPVKQNVLRAFLNATRNSVRVIDARGKKIGYLHLWTMANDNFKSAMDSLVLDRLHDTDGLILDLRDGYGGSPFGYADVFTRPDVTWEMRYRGGKYVTSHTGYSKPVVVLVNEGTRSAKEFFSYQLQESRRAVLVGKPTAGAFLGAGVFNISEYGVLEMAVQGLRVDGKPLESKGVNPDFIVDAKFSYTERDEQLRVGIERLSQKIQSLQSVGKSDVVR